MNYRSELNFRKFSNKINQHVATQQSGNTIVLRLSKSDRFLSHSSLEPRLYGAPMVAILHCCVICSMLTIVLLFNKYLMHILRIEIFIECLNKYNFSFILQQIFLFVGLLTK